MWRLLSRAENAFCGVVAWVDRRPQPVAGAIKKFGSRVRAGVRGMMGKIEKLWVKTLPPIKDTWAVVRRASLTAVLWATAVGAVVAWFGREVGGNTSVGRVTRAANTVEATLSADQPVASFEINPAERRMLRVHARPSGDGTRLLLVNLGGDAKQHDVRVLDLGGPSWTTWDVPVRYKQVRIELVAPAEAKATVRVFVSAP